VRRLLALLVPVLVAGVIGTELAMPLSPAERAGTYMVYAVTAVVTIVLYAVVTRLAPRTRRLALLVASVGVVTVLASAVAIVLAAGSMVVDNHDRDVVLVTLGMGVGLAAALALAVGESVTRDLDRITAVACAVMDGDLTVRTGIERPDEVGALASAVDSMTDRLEASEEERKILIASVGHDLRTPLASLQAAIEAVEDGVAPDPSAYLSGMGKDVEHLGRLVEDLFAYAKIESGLYEPQKERLDLRELADETIEVCAPIAHLRGVELSVEVAAVETVDADSVGMGRVLRNLVDNAIRHAPHGGTVRLVLRGTSISVVDDGPGFPAEFRRVAFDRFTRADPARSGAGTGLGLAIARGIVEAHGGTISIDEGVGGRVRVQL
jgi:two-component system sensor histidine kinase BaeS